MSITLNTGQKSAAETVMDFLLQKGKSEIVIEGPAGTGKSTLVEYILKDIVNQRKLLKLIMGTPTEKELAIEVTATTNKAAKVISALVGTEARTIQSFLNLTIKPNFKDGTNDLVPTNNYVIIRNKIIFIDECSFIDLNLLDWIRKTTLNCKIVFIGDPFQLAPVRVSQAPVFSQGIEAVRLTEIMRNGGAIQALSNQYRDTVESSIFPVLKPNQLDVMHVSGPSFQSMVNKEFFSPLSHLNLIPVNSKIIAWSNDKVIEYNDYIRDLNGFGKKLEVGEEVITNKPILVGDFHASTDSSLIVTSVGDADTQHFVDGYYVELNESISMFVPNNPKDMKGAMKRLAKAKEWHDYFGIKNTWGDLRSPYACTIHKSQGSTYDKVFIDLSDIGRCNISTDVARMLYVAISRASRQVILYGSLPIKYGVMEHAA